MKVRRFLSQERLRTLRTHSRTPPWGLGASHSLSTRLCSPTPAGTRSTSSRRRLWIRKGLDFIQPLIIFWQLFIKPPPKKKNQPFNVKIIFLINRKFIMELMNMNRRLVATWILKSRLHFSLSLTFDVQVSVFFFMQEFTPSYCHFYADCNNHLPSDKCGVLLSAGHTFLHGQWCSCSGMCQSKKSQK